MRFFRRVFSRLSGPVSVIALSLALWLPLPGPAAGAQAPEGRCVGIDASGPCLSGYAPLLMSRIPREQLHMQADWERVLAEHDPEAAFGKGQKDLPSHHLQQWKNLAALMPSLDPIKQLQYINGFFNYFPSKKDEENYSREEYWATPAEFMAKGGGDCEDYAIAKYLALRRFDWPAENMWLLIVRGRKDQERHAVLVVREKNRLLVLDNLSRPVQQLVPEKTFLTNFVPLFALNEKGFWYFAGSNSTGTNTTGANSKGR